MSKSVLEKCIICSDVNNMRKVIDKLNSLGYQSKNSMPLFNVWVHSYQWDLGMRVINLYSNKDVKFASKETKTVKILTDIDF